VADPGCTPRVWTHVTQEADIEDSGEQILVCGLRGGKTTGGDMSGVGKRREEICPGGKMEKGICPEGGLSVHRCIQLFWWPIGSTPDWREISGSGGDYLFAFLFCCFADFGPKYIVSL